LNGGWVENDLRIKSSSVAFEGRELKKSVQFLWLLAKEDFTH
jgi:hypothetical protein